MMKRNYFVHPTSIIDSGAVIGSGTRIWHFCHLMPKAIVGDNCIIGQNVFIDNNVVIGNNVKIQNNVSIYTGVLLEDSVFVGPSVVFTNVYNPRSNIERKNEFRQTIIKTGASIGANATIVCGNNIGKFAFIGAGAVVTKEALAYVLMVGNPAKQIGWMSEAGSKLNFNKAGWAKCLVSGQTYSLKNNLVSKV